MIEPPFCLLCKLVFIQQQGEEGTLHPVIPGQITCYSDSGLQGELAMWGEALSKRDYSCQVEGCVSHRILKSTSNTLQDHTFLPHLCTRLKADPGAINGYLGLQTAGTFSKLLLTLYSARLGIFDLQCLKTIHNYRTKD